MLHGSRFLHLLLNFLDPFELGCTAGCPFTSDQSTDGRLVFHEAGEHEFLGLLFEAILEHVIDISWRQFSWRPIQAVVQVGRHSLPHEHLVQDV